jgi:hypothetical protein
MTTRKNLFAVLSSLVMIFAVGSFAFGQDTATQDKGATQDTTQTQKGARGDFKHFGSPGHGFGKGGFGRHKGGRMGGGMMHGGFARLNLSEEQKGQLKSLREGFRTSTEAQRKEMFSLFQQKRDNTLTAEGEARIKELRSQFKTAGEGLHSSMLNVLTAEQKTQLETMKQEHKQKMKEFRKNRQQRTPNTETPAATTKKDNAL